MSDKSSVKPAPAPVRIAPPPAVAAQPAPRPPQQARSIFDCTPANVSTARGKAEATRRAFQQAIAATRAALKHHEDAVKAVESDADFAAFFAHEGLSKDVLKKFGDLATPFVITFTAS